MNQCNSLFLTLLALLILLPATGLAQQDSAAADADTKTLYKEEYKRELQALSREFGREGYELDALMQDERFEVYGTIGDRFRNSAERTTPTLAEYKEILAFEEKIQQGVDFMEQHREQLRRAEQEYGIPTYLITAILGIESKYGQVTGSYNPFNVYVSMAVVDYRADFAKAQLRELLEFVNRENIDVFTLKSSYAGAMSPAQFIPYSVNKWWVGRSIDDMDNSILSVANYLAYFRERTGSLRTAVLRYNPSELYRDAILDLADAIEEAAAETNS